MIYSILCGILYILRWIGWCELLEGMAMVVYAWDCDSDLAGEVQKTVPYRDKDLEDPEDGFVWACGSQKALAKLCEDIIRGSEQMLGADAIESDNYVMALNLMGEIYS